MRIFTEQALKAYTMEHPDSLVPLQEWKRVVKNARWTCFADIKNDFNSVDSVGNQHYVCARGQVAGTFSKEKKNLKIFNPCSSKAAGIDYIYIILLLMKLMCQGTGHWHVFKRKAKLQKFSIPAV